jgi:serine/threonine protein kinase
VKKNSQILFREFKKTMQHIQTLLQANPPSITQQGLGLPAVVTKIDEIGMDLLLHMLVYIPQQRVGAKEAMTHAFFDDVPANIKQMSAAVGQP